MAHIIPHMRIIHLSPKNQLLIDFQYVLLDEAGELHAPKDQYRNEMLMSPKVESEARAQIRLDLLELVEKQHARLSPAFLRQIGMENEAMALEANAFQVQQQLNPNNRSRVPRWEVSRIVDQRGSRRNREYLVEWAGYHPSWEAWRVNGPGGAVGTPLLTWEPSRALKETEALQAWLHQEEQEELEQTNA